MVARLFFCSNAMQCGELRPTSKERPALEGLLSTFITATRVNDLETVNYTPILSSAMLPPLFLAVT
jgi:hypothetical protein